MAIARYCHRAKQIDALEHFRSASFCCSPGVRTCICVAAKLNARMRMLNVERLAMNFNCGADFAMGRKRGCGVPAAKTGKHFSWLREENFLLCARLIVSHPCALHFGTRRGTAGVFLLPPCTHK
jgi:hypothetical protein